MTDERPGDPRSVRHLRPTNMPPTPLTPFPTEEDLPEALKNAGGPGVVVPVPETDEETEQTRHLMRQLARLREQFPPERIEKLPRPKWKDAWKDKRGANCPECHGYHVLENAIHLEYVGHANVTDRLLEVDPFWYWEPMSLTEQGTPYFSDGGLWIRLTVCGVTRIGYGDGSSVKEVIGDAIRNAAMRFGVGLDLWARIDLHAERNPGDGQTSQRNRQPRTDRGQHRSRQAPQAEPQPAAPPRAANQDALEALGSVCDEYGYDRRWVAQRFESDFDVDIRHANADDITAFAALLIEQAIAEPDADDAVGGGGSGSSDEGAVVGDGVLRDAGAGDGGDQAAGGDPALPTGDPTDTSDVEPKPGDLF